jgi:hypothetical protein
MFVQSLTRNMLKMSLKVKVKVKLYFTKYHAMKKYSMFK